MGVFQLSGSGMTHYLKDLKPTQVEDLMAMVALYRPGPMAQIPEYIERKNNPEKISYFDDRMKEYLGKETFCLTYGDGVADVDIAKLVKFHKSHGKIATLTAVRPPSKFGALELGPQGQVLTFAEKPHIGDSWINGGFFVFEPEIFDYLSPAEGTILEADPMINLAKNGQLMAFHHEGYWHCMDTARDVTNANKIWEQNQAPWKLWK